MFLPPFPSLACLVVSSLIFVPSSLQVKLLDFSHYLLTRQSRYTETFHSLLSIMLKEVVSLATILGFILNIAYVDHPNTTSYTIAFVISLAFISPFVLAYRFWSDPKRYRRVKDAEDADEVLVSERGGAVGLANVTISQVLDVRAAEEMKEADLEKGVVPLLGVGVGTAVET